MYTQTAIFELDDYPRGYKSAIDCLDELYVLNNTFKATVFAIPSEMTEEYWQPLLERSWIRVGMHSFTHAWHEGKMVEKVNMGRLMKQYRDSRFCNLFKAPHYGYSTPFVSFLKGEEMIPCVKNVLDLLSISSRQQYWVKEIRLEIGMFVCILQSIEYKSFHCHTEEVPADVTNINKRIKKYRQYIPGFNFIFSEEVVKWV